MNIVYMGTPEIAATVLEAVIASGKHNILAVVTQPDKPKGRGHEMAMSEVKMLALKENIKVFQPEKASDPQFMEEMRALAPDIIVVTAYGKILKEELLNLPRLGCINVHASLLPKYRGASPIQWAVINGEEKSGVTIMHMARGLDTGDMILAKEVTLDKEETAGSLHDKLAAIGGPAVLEAMDMLENGTAPRTVQDESKACYVTTIDKSFGKMDFSKSAEELERLIRGLNPWPTAFTSLDGKMLKIFGATVVEEVEVSKEFKKAACGTIVKVTADSIFVKCGKGFLDIRMLQIEGKKRMASADFLRGYKVSEGTVLG